MKVNFHIQRLVIEGASHSEALRVAEALRARLSELPAAGKIAKAANIGRLDAGVLPPRSSAGQIGHHIAGQIFTTLKGPHHG
ncbi:MAG TPA: hypothetical protein VGJ33_10955 [Candidatus Angelobacter sp.]|jgi:hypothetical protein